jgi:hypothetical protein
MFLLKPRPKVSYSLAQKRVGAFKVPLQALEQGGSTGPGLGREKVGIETVESGRVLAVTGDGVEDELGTEGSVRKGFGA